MVSLLCIYVILTIIPVEQHQNISLDEQYNVNVLNFFIVIALKWIQKKLYFTRSMFKKLFNVI